MKYDKNKEQFSLHCTLEGSIENEDEIQIKFVGSESKNVYFAETPQSSVSFAIDKNMFGYVSQQIINLLDILFYIFFVIVILSWLTFAFSLLRQSVSGIETMFVIQFAFVSFLFNTAKYEEYQNPFRCTFPLKHSFGYNLLFDSQSHSEVENVKAPFLSQNEMGTLFFDNLNIMFVFLSAPPLFCLFFYCRFHTLRTRFHRRENSRTKHNKVNEQNGKNKNNENENTDRQMNIDDDVEFEEM